MIKNFALKMKKSYNGLININKKCKNFFLNYIDMRDSINSLLEKIDLQELSEDLQYNLSLEDEKKLTPSKIKVSLDMTIIGQDKVKRYVANSLRNRYRKRVIMDQIERNKFYNSFGNNDNCSDNENKNIDLDSIKSHNMLIYGKSGSGKTEILRKTAKICHSPYIKVDATKYTEVGYVGSSVEDIIKDLFLKTKKEFESSLQKMFWENNSVKKAWEDFVLINMFGQNYENNLKKLSKNQTIDISEFRKNVASPIYDNLELCIWNTQEGRFSTNKFSDYKESLFKVAKDAILKKNPINEMIIKNIENRSIVVIDEFDKLVKNDVRFFIYKGNYKR